LLLQALVIAQEARVLLLLRDFRDTADLKYTAQSNTHNPFIRHAHVFVSQVMKVVIRVPTWLQALVWAPRIRALVLASRLRKAGACTPVNAGRMLPVAAG
jgi:hypothetical protein